MISRSPELATYQTATPTFKADEWSMGRIELVKAEHLCGELATRWCEIRNSSRRFDSPYFDVEFTKAVSRIRNDVEVAIVEDEAGAVQCFLPFQRISNNQAVPVGGKLNDIQGIIGSPGDPGELMLKILKAGKLKSYQFHAGLRFGEYYKPHEFEVIESHHLDLSAGWDSYLAWARKHSRTIKRQGQKTRALEREIGPITFEFECNSNDVLNRLIELKRSKYQRSNTFDILSVEWARKLVRELSQVDSPGFKGILSALWAGDKLVGTHFGMLTNDILHYWFPVYDPIFSKYSPGTELLLSAAKSAASIGVKKVDLGYGDDTYKFKFSNGHDQLSCGRFTSSSLDFAVAKQRYRVRKKLKEIPMKPLAKSVLRKFYPGFGEWNFK